jgi:hypothetical protein
VNQSTRTSPFAISRCAALAVSHRIAPTNPPQPTKLQLTKLSIHLDIHLSKHSTPLPFPSQQQHSKKTTVAVAVAVADVQNPRQPQHGTTGWHEPRALGTRLLLTAGVFFLFFAVFFLFFAVFFLPLRKQAARTTRHSSYIVQAVSARGDKSLSFLSFFGSFGPSCGGGRGACGHCFSSERASKHVRTQRSKCKRVVEKRKKNRKKKIQQETGKGQVDERGGVEIIVTAAVWQQ